MLVNISIYHHTQNLLTKTVKNSNHYMHVQIRLVVEIANFIFTLAKWISSMMVSTDTQ